MVETKETASLPRIASREYDCAAPSTPPARAKVNTTVTQGLHILKKLLLSAITTDAGLGLLAPLRPRCASILFLHRFAVPDLGVLGHDPGVLRAHLEYLRKRKYQLMSVSDLVLAVEKGAPFEKRSVVFTVDDGYADFAAVAAPVFAAFDCPVTVFLITDFVHGRLWNWFDKVDWVFRETPRRELRWEIGGQTVIHRWTSLRQRDAASEDVVERLKRVPDAVKERGITSLATALEVILPDGVPDRDKAMTWDEIRACARLGVTFGPHTVTHPILAQVDAMRAQREITDSWATVSSETKAAVPVFCYPNGRTADFSARDEEIVAKAGLRAALSTTEKSVVLQAGETDAIDRFAIPRFSYPEDKSRLVQIASGIEAMRAGFQRGNP
jgi:peptidoglycan/xylan/chitin deacetylase (PgdA/CDA1 family)